MSDRWPKIASYPRHILEQMRNSKKIGSKLLGQT